MSERSKHLNELRYGKERVEKEPTTFPEEITTIRDLKAYITKAEECGLSLDTVVYLNTEEIPQDLTGYVHPTLTLYEQEDGDDVPTNLVLEHRDWDIDPVKVREVLGHHLTGRVTEGEIDD